MTKWLYCPECKSELDNSGEFPKCPSGHFVKYPTPVASAFVLMSHDGKYLLMKRDYQPRLGSWSVPGGFIEPGESAEEGLAREIFEETKIKIDISRLEYLGTFYQEYGNETETKNLGTAFCLEFDDEPVVELNHEHSEYIWRSLDEIPEIASDDIRHAFEHLQNNLSKVV